jgi:gas vesicle protein
MASTLNHEEPRANAELERLVEQLSDLGLGATRDPSDDPQSRMNTFRPAVLGDRPSLRRWALRGIGFLLTACIVVAAIAWWQPSHGDAVTKASPQPALRAQTAPEDVAPTATMSPQLTQQLQSMARDLATLAQGIERLKASQDQLVRDNANAADQFTQSQEQITGAVAKVSQQLKESQEQIMDAVSQQLKESQEEIARNNANFAEQLKVSQEQSASILAKLSEQDLRPKISSPTPPGQTANPKRKPAPTLSSPQATTKPQAGKPQLSSPSQRPVPVH